MAGKIRHLLERGGRYYARLAVPVKLRPIVGKLELTEALDADKRIAERMLPGVLARMHAQLDAARLQIDPSAKKRRTIPVRGRPMSNRQVALAHYESELETDERVRNAGIYTKASHGWDSYIEKLRLVAAGIETDPAAIGAYIGWAINSFQERGNVPVTPAGSAEWRELARTLASVHVEALERVKERDRGDFSGKPKLPILTAPEPTSPDPLAARVLSPDSMLPLSEIVPKFLAERKISSASQHEHVVSARMFEEHLGEPKPIYKITRRDVLDYKNALLELPSNYVKRFPNSTLPDAIKLNQKRAQQFPTLDPRTVNDKWLSNLRALFNWCVSNDIVPDSPANGIKANFQSDSGEPSRVPFDPSDLTKIFSKPLFDHSKQWGEQQWSYLLSLYCGTRPSELAQVKLDSIRHERGILVMRVQEKTKNTGSQRAIPIHSHLMKLGFGEYVEGLRRNGAAHLFPVWYERGTQSKAQANAKTKATGQPDTLDKHFPKFIPRRFNDTYRKKVGIHDARKDFYAFRHTFKTGLAQAGVVKDVRDSLTGHVDSSPGAVYVHDVSLEALRDAIERLQFDGLPNLEKS